MLDVGPHPLRGAVRGEARRGRTRQGGQQQEEQTSRKKSFYVQIVILSSNLQVCLLEADPHLNEYFGDQTYFYSLVAAEAPEITVNNLLLFDKERLRPLENILNRGIRLGIIHYVSR